MQTVSEAPSRVKQASLTRFNIRQRVEHIVLMTTFIVLAVTGIVQRFSTVSLAQWVILGLGGIETTRIIHRAFAVVLIVGISYHFAYLDYLLFVRRANLAMMPTFKDFRDIVSELKHGLGIKTQRPEFGRYDYRQKFEYLGLIFGSVILIVSGFILAFPVAVTRVLPGQVVAAAVEFHGNEATLAILTIIVWHLYDVMFRPGIFPADTSIFTGRISRERMFKEHFLEYIERTAGKNAAPASPAQD